MSFLRKYPKVSALLGTAVAAGAAYYGVPPGTTDGILARVCAALGC